MVSARIRPGNLSTSVSTLATGSMTSATGDPGPGSGGRGGTSGSGRSVREGAHDRAEVGGVQAGGAGEDAVDGALGGDVGDVSRIDGAAVNQASLLRHASRVQAGQRLAHVGGDLAHIRYRWRSHQADGGPRRIVGDDERLAQVGPFQVRFDLLAHDVRTQALVQLVGSFADAQDWSESVL